MQHFSCEYWIPCNSIHGIEYLKVSALIFQYIGILKTIFLFFEMQHLSCEYWIPCSSIHGLEYLILSALIFKYKSI